jgi:hypothetical protein
VALIHELNYTFHVQWSLLRDTDGREIWFPSTMKVTMHSQRSSQPGAERIITVQTEFEIDPKSVVWGDPAENLDTSIQIPQGMTVKGPSHSTQAYQSHAASEHESRRALMIPEPTNLSFRPPL